MKSTYKVYCEGDIEKFSGTLRALILKAKPCEIIVKCPTEAWPFMILDMIGKDFEDMPDRDDNIVGITFAPDRMNSSAEWAAEADELASKIGNMSDDELEDFLNDILGDLDDEDDDDDDDDTDSNGDDKL